VRSTLVVSLMLFGWVVGLPAHGEPTDPPPVALTTIGESALEIFDAARAHDWTMATPLLEDIDDAETDLPPDLPHPDLVARLHTRIASLHRAVRDRLPVPAMSDANAIARLVAEISDGFQAAVPFEITVLGYYGRQIAIGVAGNRAAMRQQSVADLVEAWKQAEPLVLRRGDEDEAREFAGLVVQLDGARQPSDISAAADAEITAAGRLEQLFAARP
jgi:hypothetical protein